MARSCYTTVGLPIERSGFEYWTEALRCMCSWVTRHSASLHQDNSIHRLNRYPVDSVVCFANTYPLDSDFYQAPVV